MWNLDEVKIGDFIKVQIVNKRGDRNLDGLVIKGIVKELVPTYRFARLDSGWCAHTKDILLEHKEAEDHPHK